MTVSSVLNKDGKSGVLKLHVQTVEDLWSGTIILDDFFMLKGKETKWDEKDTKEAIQWFNVSIDSTKYFCRRRILNSNQQANGILRN